MTNYLIRKLRYHFFENWILSTSIIIVAGPLFILTFFLGVYPLIPEIQNQVESVCTIENLVNIPYKCCTLNDNRQNGAPIGGDCNYSLANSIPGPCYYYSYQCVQNNYCDTGNVYCGTCYNQTYDWLFITDTGAMNISIHADCELNTGCQSFKNGTELNCWYDWRDPVHSLQFVPKTYMSVGLVFMLMGLLGFAIIIIAGIVVGIGMLVSKFNRPRKYPPAYPSSKECDTLNMPKTQESYIQTNPLQNNPPIRRIEKSEWDEERERQQRVLSNMMSTANSST